MSGPGLLMVKLWVEYARRLVWACELDRLGDWKGGVMGLWENKGLNK